MHSDGGPELVLGRLHATVGDADAAAPPPPLEEEPEPAVAEAAVRLPAVELRFSKAKASHHAPAKITASAAALSSSAVRARLSPVDISALKAFATDLALLAPPSSGVFTAQHARMSLSEALIELAPPSDYFGGAAALEVHLRHLELAADRGFPGILKAHVAMMLEVRGGGVALPLLVLPSPSDWEGTRHVAAKVDGAPLRLDLKADGSGRAIELRVPSWRAALTPAAVAAAARLLPGGDAHIKGTRGTKGAAAFAAARRGDAVGDRPPPAAPADAAPTPLQLTVRMRPSRRGRSPAPTTRRTACACGLALPQSSSGAAAAS